MTSEIRLIPSLDVGRLGGKFFIFDRSAAVENTFPVPTQEVSAAMAKIIKKVVSLDRDRSFNSLDDLLLFFPAAQDQRRVQSLLKAGYLEASMGGRASSVMLEKSANPALEIEFSAPHNLTVPIPDQISHFDTIVLKKRLGCHQNFFRLPDQSDWNETDVGIVGVPISSVKVTAGTVLGPAALRQQSQDLGFWFDIFEDGLYSETQFNGGPPRVICKDIVVADAGDICQSASKVEDVFSEIRTYVDTKMHNSKAKSIFIGGDHAITFPIVDAFLRHYPDLVLIHLDAHNDLHYTSNLDFNHAGPMNSLIYRSKLSSLYSFGVRTFAEPRVGNWRKFADSGFDRVVRQYEINKTKRLINSENGLRDLLLQEVGVDRPCYLTIDLDVLTENAVAGAVSTPVSGGLEFAELLSFVTVTLDTLNIVSADIVEYNPLASTGNLKSVSPDLTCLLTHIIEGLGRSGERVRNRLEASDTRSSAKKQLTGCESSKENNSSRARKLKLKINEVPRLAASDLTYNVFLNDFVKSKTPLALTGLHPSDGIELELEDIAREVAAEEMVKVQKFAQPNDLSRVSSTYIPAHMALRAMAFRHAKGQFNDAEAWSIIDWNYGVALPSLRNAFKTPDFFNVSVNEDLGLDASQLKWFYVGEAGTGSATHIDVFFSSAWFFLLKGKKQWRFLCDVDRSAVVESPFPDLFNVDRELSDLLLDSKAQLYNAEQRSGELIWTPSKISHAVLNRELSFGITHNYIDHSNLHNFEEWMEMETDNSSDASFFDGAIDFDAIKSLASQKASRLDWYTPLVED